MAGLLPAELDAGFTRLRHLPLRDGRAWAPPSLEALFDRARAQGLLAQPG